MKLNPALKQACFWIAFSTTQKAYRSEWAQGYKDGKKDVSRDIIRCSLTNRNRKAIGEEIRRCINNLRTNYGRKVA